MVNDIRYRIVYGILCHTWLFLLIRGPFCGCPDRKCPTILGSISELLIFGKLPYEP